MTQVEHILRARCLDWRYRVFISRAMREGLEVSFRRQTVMVEGYRFVIHNRATVWQPKWAKGAKYYRYQLVSPRIHVVTTPTGKQLVYLPHERPKGFYFYFRYDEHPAERWPTPEAWEEARARRGEFLPADDGKLAEAS